MCMLLRNPICRNAEHAGHAEKILLCELSELGVQPISRSRPSRREATGARHPDELRQPPRFRFGDRRAQRRDAVIAPSLVVVFRRRPFARLDEQSLLEHALNRSIERTGAELQLAAGSHGHILDDGVAVAVFACHREQDMERRRRKRQQFVDLVLVDNGGQCTSL